MSLMALRIKQLIGVCSCILIEAALGSTAPLLQPFSRHRQSALPIQPEPSNRQLSLLLRHVRRLWEQKVTSTGFEGAKVRKRSLLLSESGHEAREGPLTREARAHSDTA